MKNQQISLFKLMKLIKYFQTLIKNRFLICMEMKVYNNNKQWISMEKDREDLRKDQMLELILKLL